MVAIWSGGVDGIADPADVESVAAAGATWRTDVERLGPWRPGRLSGLAEPVWVADRSGPAPWILVAGACSSCMDIAWHLQGAGALPPHGAVLAVRQWAGRGQMGRSWISPPGNLYGAWVLPSGEESGPAFPVLLGYAILLALRELGVAAEMKWPNDVLVSGRKMAGILCEQRGPVLVAGIGINLMSCPGPEEVHGNPAATALSEHGVDARPLDFWMRVLRIGRIVLAPEARSQAMSQSERHLAFRGRWAEVRPWSDPPFRARVEGLDPDGALRVRGPAGEQRVVSASLAAAE